MQTGSATKCLVCEHDFNWVAYVKQGESVPDTSNATETVVGEIVAYGKIITSEGNKIKCEVYVTCPYCENKNKFDVQI